MNGAVLVQLKPNQHVTAMEADATDKYMHTAGWTPTNWHDNTQSTSRQVNSAA
jgi:hypothetical protein